MADLYPFKLDFDPILLPGETAHLIKSDAELDVEVRALIGLPEYQHDFGAVTGGTWTLNQNPNVVEMNTMEMAQLRVRVIDDIQLYLKNPGSVELWRGTRQRFYLRQTDGLPEHLTKFFFACSQFYVYEDE